jgi:hypothetical protein
MAYVPIVPYADRTYGDAYFLQRLNTEDWDNATQANQDKALAEATRLIDLLPLVGYKYDEAQVREFPRSVDDEGVIDPAVPDACCEVAIALLGGNTLDQLASSVGIKAESLGDSAVTYTGERGAMALVDESFGLPSPVAARLLAPWIEDPENIDITHV